jgi:hypothetical protein
MANEPQPAAPTGVRAWEPDTYQVLHFMHGLHNLRAKRKSTLVPSLVMERLGGVAGVVDKEIFQAGITFAIQTAHKDFPLLSASVYHGQLVGRIAKVERAADKLWQQLQAIRSPKDRTTLWAGKAISAQLNIKSRETGEWERAEWPDRLDPLASHLRELMVLSEAIRKAKTTWPYAEFAKKKGKPSGVSGAGIVVTRLIAHLEFAARAAGGHWTLSKNDQRGTLIVAIEQLREFLPPKLLPKDGHPFSTYQRILTRARSEWKNSPFPAIMLRPTLDQK